MFFGQTFDAHDLAIVGLLIVLEGVLSIDNALVLGILAGRLPKEQQRRALTYGLAGAFVFRVAAIAMAQLLLTWTIAKLIGGAYLIYTSIKHFFFEHRDPTPEGVRGGPDGHPVLVDADSGVPLAQAESEHELLSRSPAAVTSAAAVTTPGAGARIAKFWPTVFVIELTDIAFAIDSILAAIAMVSTTPTPVGQALHPKLWVVVTGGMLGVVLMRFAAVVFIRLLERFPRFEVSAYLLVIVIGLKLVADWAFNRGGRHVLDFHDVAAPEFWVFWAVMLACFAFGFVPPTRGKPGQPPLR